MHQILTCFHIGDKQVRLRDVPLGKPSVNEQMKIWSLGLHFFNVEATFHPNDHVNIKTCDLGVRLRTSISPVSVEKVTVWCGLGRNGITASCWFEDSD